MSSVTAASVNHPCFDCESLYFIETPSNQAASPGVVAGVVIAVIAVSAVLAVTLYYTKKYLRSGAVVSNTLILLQILQDYLFTCVVCTENIIYFQI